MDMWLFYDVTHRLHTYCNPVNTATVRELEEILGLTAESHVLDIACGMGEMLVGFAERYGSSGVGVDLSPYALQRAEQRKASRVPDADLRFLLLDGKDYQPAPGERFDVVLLIGASWIWDGYRGTLEALRQLVVPGGLVVIGEPHFNEEPPAEYLEAEGLEPDQFGTLKSNLDEALRQRLQLVWMRGCSDQDWDRYEMLQAAAVDRFSREHPDHPDLAEIRSRHERARDIYLRWGRRYLGFAIWVFRR